MGILASFGVLETEGGGPLGRSFALTFIFVVSLAHVWIETMGGG